MSGYTLSSKTDANNLVYIGKNVIDYYDYMFKIMDYMPLYLLPIYLKEQRLLNF